jgi:N-methylhydantoinase A/oxoprolinase/acetone carboxylase beta subunit
MEGLMIRIGVDVGGTNTDAVVMVGRQILATTKVPTSADVTSGLMQALHEVQAQAGIAPGDVRLVVIGTTHFTNAVIERRHLSATAVVRLCLPAAQCLPPMVDWPADLRAAVGDHVYLASGGVEFDGTPIAAFDPAEIRRIGRAIRGRGIDCIAVAGVFAPVKDQYELEAAALLAEECPGARITVSSAIGQLGLLERESATILNSALTKLAHVTVAALREGVEQCGITCPLYLSQNDGTLMASDQAQRFPVLTFASGPTNSMRGAAFLTGRAEAIVIDIGGTTTDVGLLHKGFPRQAGSTVDVGGVRTNFRMPDVFSIGLGGGSKIAEDTPLPRVGPQSVGYELLRQARVFGGDVLTATDIAVATGRARIGEAARVQDVDPAFARRCLAVIDQRLAAAADRARVSPEGIAIVAVGGGSILMPPMLGTLEVIRPEHFAVANAIGAAIAQTSGEVDRIYSLETMSREAALGDAENQARSKAVAAGALPGSIEVTEREDVPLAYLRGNATRVRVKVVGDMEP